MRRLLLALLSTSLFACEPAEQSTSTAVTAPGGTVIGGCAEFPEVIDFGEVELRQLATATAVVVNPTGFTVRVQVKSVADPFTVARGSFTLAPMTRTSIAFGFTPIDSRASMGLVRFESFTSGCPQVLVPITGRGAGEVVFNKSSLTFPPTPVGVTSEVEFTAMNTRRTPVEVRFAYSPGDAGVGLLQHPARLALEPGELARLPVRFRPAREGAEFGLLRTTFSAPQPFPGISVTAVGGIPRAQVSRARIAIEHFPLFGAAQRRLFLRNVGGGVLLLDRVDVLTDAGMPLSVSVGNRAVHGGEATVLQVMPSAMGAGDFSWTVRLSTNDPFSPTLDVPVAVRPERVYPCRLEVEAATPTVAPPYPAVVPVVFTNRASSPCLVEALGPVADAPVTTDLGDDDSFFVPANQQVVRQVTVLDAGQHVLSWRTYLTSESTVLLDAP